MLSLFQELRTIGYIIIVALSCACNSVEKIERSLAKTADCTDPSERFSINSIKSLADYNVLLSDYKAAVEPHHCLAVITNVNVVDVEDHSLKQNAIVVIDHGIITHVLRKNRLRKRMLKPNGSGCVRFIDGTGKFLAPGLADMHMHYSCPNVQRLTYLVNGITTIRAVSASNYTLSDARFIQSNVIIGPQILTTSQSFNFKSNRNPSYHNSINQMGYGSAYLNEPLLFSEMDSIVAEIESFRLPLSMDYRFELPKLNYPSGTVFENWSNLKHIQSLSEIDSYWFISRFHAERYTYSAHLDFAPKDLALDLLKSRYKQFCIGTESTGLGGIREEEGKFEQEIKTLLDMGVNNDIVLEMATMNAGTMHAEQSLKLFDSRGEHSKPEPIFGLVKEGYLSNLVLLENNPLIRMTNYRKPLMVFVGNQIYSSEDLIEMRDVLQLRESGRIE